MSEFCPYTYKGYPVGLKYPWTFPMPSEKERDRRWYEIRKSKGRRRVAAVRLLGRVGTPSSVPFLHQLTRVPDLHDAGVRALVGLADPETLARLATVETDTALRRDLVCALLKREGKTALGAYLRLAAAPPTRDIALELLDQCPELSRDTLDPGHPDPAHPFARQISQDSGLGERSAML